MTHFKIGLLIAIAAPSSGAGLAIVVRHSNVDEREREMTRFVTWTMALAWAAVLVSAVITMQSAQAQSFNTLYGFDGTDGANSVAGLIQATNGRFYGTTDSGGVNNDGTVFEFTPSGSLSAIYSFCSQTDCTDGWDPVAGLIQATNGDLYGTTFYGGATGDGSVFKMTLGGTLTTLHSFSIGDGEGPAAALIQATNGDLYGTTMVGGAHGDGTVFKITPSGTLTRLYSFDGKDGKSPVAALVQATNGDFYGTTYGGGAHNRGTVFKLSPGGTLNTLHSFDGTDGANPGAGLVQASNGDLYGVTGAEGANGGGTIFKITEGGTLTTLYSFCSQSSCTDGKDPDAGLIQATDGNLYGTTNGGGANGAGTVFSINLGGTLTTLFSFSSQSGSIMGANPSAGVIQATDGSFYGTTYAGGYYGYGTVFNVSMGFSPFVKTQTTSGKVGADVKILGNDLTGATSVTFKGTAATFTVVSSSEIKTTVPTGATTGYVDVVTLSSGTLQSNVVYTVKP
jgi:uncharacterized repeat protein (TIGR03803 family)